jgi:hypothetical protein
MISVENSDEVERELTLAAYPCSETMKDQHAKFDFEPIRGCATSVVSTKVLKAIASLTRVRDAQEIGEHKQ